MIKREHVLFYSGVFLMFNDIALDDNTTSILTRDVRVIQCHSDKTDTFDEDQHGWTFPNGSKVTNISTLAIATPEGGTHSSGEQLPSSWRVLLQGSGCQGNQPHPLCACGAKSLSIVPAQTHQHQQLS